MNQNVFSNTIELDDLSEAEMLEIAMNLNNLEPGAGGVMPESSAEWAMNAFESMGSLVGFGVFTVLTVASVVFILALPTLIKEFRNFWNKPQKHLQ